MSLARPPLDTFRRVVVPLIAAASLGACADASPTVSDPAPPVALSTTSATADEPVECPVSTTRSTSGLVTALGGTLTLGGHSVHVPAGAVLGPTTLTLIEPASNHMEIAVHAGGAEHFSFLAPVSITISYARCTRANIDKGPLTVWHVDEETGAFLEHMGGTDDKDARTVTFGTDHLSGYVIAN